MHIWKHNWSLSKIQITDNNLGTLLSQLFVSDYWHSVTASATEPRATTLTLTGAAELSDQESVRGIAGAVECLSSVIILDNSASLQCIVKMNNQWIKQVINTLQSFVIRLRSQAWSVRKGLNYKIFSKDMPTSCVVISLFHYKGETGIACPFPSIRLPFLGCDALPVHMAIWLPCFKHKYCNVSPV